MSTSINVILKRLAVIFIAALVLFGITLIFTYDIIKIDWPSFMEIQPSFKPMEDPLPVPTASIPIEGPIAIPNQVPVNPVAADEASITRGRELFMINCEMCHGATGQGDGTIGAFIVNKPADLTGPIVQSLSDGAIFLTITNGFPGRMPALNENFTVRERWDLVNYVRTLKPPQ